MTLRITPALAAAFFAGMAVGIVCVTAFFCGWFSPALNPPLSY